MITLTELQTRRLYSLCFEDDEAFTEAYFRHLSLPRHTMIIRQGSEVVSALQIVPTEIRLSNHAPEGIPSGYLSGICTRPDHRGKGLMHNLLKNTFRRLYKMQQGFATLIPASESLFDLYARSGFTPCFDHSVKELQLPDLPSRRIRPLSLPEAPRWRRETEDNLPQKLHYTLCRKEHIMYPLHYLQERRDYHGYQSVFGNFWQLVQEDMHLYGGEMWLVTTPENILVGVAICYPQEDHLYIPALTADNDRISRAITRRLSAHYHQPLLRIDTEPDAETGILPLGMARVIHARRALQEYARLHPEVHTSFTLTDPLIPENNRTFILQGKGRLSYLLKPSTTVTIEELTRALLGYHPEQLPPPLQCFPEGMPYMHLMLNK